MTKLMDDYKKANRADYYETESVNEVLKKIAHSGYALFNSQPVRVIIPTIGMITIVGDIIDIAVKDVNDQRKHFIIDKNYRGEYGDFSKYTASYKRDLREVFRKLSRSKDVERCFEFKETTFAFLNMGFKVYERIIEKYGSFETASFTKVFGDIKVSVKIDNNNDLHRIVISDFYGKTLIDVNNGMIVVNSLTDFTMKDMLTVSLLVNKVRI